MSDYVTKVEDRAARAEAENERLREELRNCKAARDEHFKYMLQFGAERDDDQAELTRLREQLQSTEAAYDDEVEHYRVELIRLREKCMRLEGRLAATQDHHDAEHEKCARNALKEEA